MAYDCAVCFEQYLQHNLTGIDGSLVCHRCVRHVFEQAVQSEENYPPKWYVNMESTCLGISPSDN